MDTINTTVIKQILPALTHIINIEVYLSFSLETCKSDSASEEKLPLGTIKLSPDIKSKSPWRQRRAQHSHCHDPNVWPVDRGSWGGEDGWGLKLKEHLIDNKESLINQLNSRINALKIVTRYAPFKSRLMLANRIYLSKMVYLIQLWGGTSKMLLNALQVSQNKMMKVITRSSWFTPARVLLKQCGWLSVRQLVSYHTALSVHKIVTTGKPEYHYGKMCISSHDHNTRSIVNFSEQFKGKASLTLNSFCYRGTRLYQRLPIEVTQVNNISTFKRKLKVWIKMNIDVWWKHIIFQFSLSSPIMLYLYNDPKLQQKYHILNVLENKTN